jgi:aryl-alcohol dehydrogenase-like predicted oxidoreductase
MEYRNLGRSALRVSRIGLGGVTFGRETDAETSFAIMDRALECGITLFDTAEAYAAGRSEEFVGQWMTDRRSRQQIVLATKVTPPLSRERILKSAEASLRRLHTDHVDLFQLHAWDNGAPLEETLEALDVLVRGGKARYLGCSNLAAWQLCKALWRQDAHGWVRMESVQPNYNLVVRDIERELLPLCADQEIGVLSYSQLGGGFFTGKYVQGEAAPKGSRLDTVPGMQPIYLHDSGYRVLAGLRMQAQALGTSTTLLALAWAMSHPGITSTLIGARSVEHVDQAIAAQAMGMSPELRSELSAL